MQIDDDNLLLLMLRYPTSGLLLLCASFKTEVLLTGICCFYLHGGQIFLFVDNFKKCIVYQSHVFLIRMIMHILYCKCVLYIDA